MSTARRLHYSYQDYLRALEDSDIKLEYCSGIIYAMAGGTLAHAQLSAAAIRILGSLLLDRCDVLSSDAKVRVEASDLSTFPDASVVCGGQKTSAIDSNALVNPMLLVEVTSRSTEEYDRGEKLADYKKIPSLQAVLFISHRSRTVTLVQRFKNGWKEREFRAGERVKINKPACELAVDEVYAGVTLDPK